MKKAGKARHNHFVISAISCCIFLSFQIGCRETGVNGETQNGDLSIQHINTHDGYSEAVTAQWNSIKTVYVSGQVGDGDTFEAQMRSALSNLEASLEAAGATMEDVVKMNTYIVDYTPETLEAFRRVRKELMGELKMPASTLVGVEALALPDWKIEIEAIAIVGNR